MAKNIYAMRDIKIGEFRETFISNDHVTAVRGLDRVLQDGKSTMCEYPADFEMYFLGSIDIKTGKIECPEAPEFITNVISAYHSLSERMKAQGRESSIAGFQGLAGKLHAAINEAEKKQGLPGIGPLDSEVLAENVAKFRKKEDK